MGWEEIKSLLPVEKTDEQKQKRKDLFDSFDPNGNGYLSFAECDKGVKTLGLDKTILPQPVLMRAFQGARSVHQEIGKNLTDAGDSYVERVEFRIFLVYLHEYLELWYMFDAIDADGDRRISFGEFQMGVEKISEWGVTVDDPQAKFDEIDTDKGGMILFNEFSAWAMDEALKVVDKDSE